VKTGGTGRPVPENGSGFARAVVSDGWFRQGILTIKAF
jgi:hypothetical protein